MSTKENLAKVKEEIVSESGDGAFLKEAGEIFDYVRKNNNVKIEDIMTNHKTFYGCFPEVVNFMLSSRIYSRKAFEKTIKKRITLPRKPEAFWELQAFYAREVYRSINKHWSATEAKKIWETTYNNYKKTFDKVMEEQKKVEDEQKEQERKASEARRAELKNYINNIVKPTVLPLL